MKVVLQRCKTASVKVDKKIVGKIEFHLIFIVLTKKICYNKKILPIYPIW